jgi:hypothetical protein
MKPGKISKLAEWGYRLEARMPEWFTPKVALLVTCIGLFILVPWWA